MVSFHAFLMPASTMIQDYDQDSSKKRKRDDGSILQPKETKCSKRLVLDTELHLETPMTLECLDIKSGYYNTRVDHKRTSMDPREPPKNMSLDLQLNLPHGSSDTPKKHHVADNLSKFKKYSSTTSNKHSGGGGGEASLWLALEGGDQQEMMTTVCKKCHMLVMMFKISPSCPNCKFMHPPNQTPPRLFNR